MKDVRTGRFLALLLAGILTASWGRAQKNEQAEVLLQAAQHKQLVEGQLEEAIKLYKNILSRYGGNRPVAAKALVQMGQCYEKLGSSESRRAYQRVLHEFADQNEMVAEARARLAALGQPPGAINEKTGPVLTELKLPSGQEPHALSPDGTKVAYTSAWHGTPRTANLMIRDLVSGAERQMTNRKEGLAMRPVWSPDGKSIAYSSWAGWGGNSPDEMRIVSFENGADRGTGISGQPVDWSRDGRYILYTQGSFEGPRTTLNLLPVGGDQPRTLLNEDRNALVERPAANFRLSPDGKFVSFARRNKQAFDIYLLSTEGGDPIPVTDHPADDRDPIWAPDGKTLLFLSNRSFGRFDLWALAIAEGKPSGEPFVVKSDIGLVHLMSLSNTGRLLFARGESRSHIYSVPIDPKTQQPSAQAVRLTRDSTVAQNSWPAWSPDGKRIAYLFSPGPGPGRERALRLMSADGSNDREIANVYEYFIGPLVWSPDNDHVYVAGRHPGTGVGIYSISTSTREKKPVLLDDQIRGHVSPAPDGKRLAFIQAGKRPQVYVADTDGRNVRQVTFYDSENAVYPTWSPDGKQIAFYKYGGARNALMLLTLEGGALTEVAGGARGSSDNYIFWEPSWSRDGNHIVWAAPGPTSKPWTLPGSDRAPELWLAKLPNGKPEPFRVNLGASETISLFSPSWSPDGTKMLFSADAQVYQLQLMENFLPALKASR